MRSLQAMVCVAALIGGLVFSQNPESNRTAAEPGEVMQPHRENLLPVPLPKLETLETTVKTQIQRFRQSLQRLIAGMPDASMEISNGYGLLGQVLHAYEFVQAAEACYLNAHTLAPDSFRWPYLLANLYRQDGQNERAIQYFQTAAALRDDYAALWVHLGDLYQQSHVQAEAKQAYDKALALETSAPALVGLGEIAMADEAYQTAALYFEKALDMVPEANQVNYSLGVAYRKMGDMDKARFYLSRAGKIGLRPRDPVLDDLQRYLKSERVHLIRGKMAFNAGHFEDAVAAFEKAVAVKPQSVRALVNLGSALGKVGRLDESIQRFREAMVLEPTNQTAAFNLGMTFATKGNLAEAEHYLRQAHSFNPKDATAGLALAEVMIKSGAEVEAIPVYTQLIEQVPLSEAAVIGLFSLYLRQGQFEKAGEVIKSAHERFADQGRMTQEYVAFLATCPDPKLRDGQQALTMAQELCDINPTPRHMEILAMALAETGDCEKAAEWQRKVVARVAEAVNPTVEDRVRAALSRYEAGEPCAAPVATEP